MPRVLLCATTSILAAFAGCNDDECELHDVVAPSSGTEPGTLQSGIAYQSALPGPLAARSDGGVASFTCRDVSVRDADLREVDRAHIQSPADLAAGPGDAMYAVGRQGARVDLT